MFTRLHRNSRKRVLCVICVVCYLILKGLQGRFPPLISDNSTGITSLDFFLDDRFQPANVTTFTKHKNNGNDEISGNYQDNWFQVMTLEMARRKAILKNHCQVLKGKQEIFHSKMASLSISDPVHNLFFCPIPKVGLNTWFRIFYALSDGDESSKANLMASTKGFKSFQKRVRKHFSTHRDAWDLLAKENTYKFTFVRHPIHRLVSGYRDKIESCSYSAMLCEWLEESFGDTSFGSFLQYLLSRQRNPCKLDIHFRPIYCNCQHCDRDYHAIGHLETFADDAKYILSQTNLSHMVPSSLLTTAYNSAGSKHHLATKSATDYMNEVSNDLRVQVIRMYALDFDFFGYSREEY